VNKVKLLHIIRNIFLFVLLGSALPVFPQFYNGSQLTFGKNRVQFTDNFWTFYRFNKFDTYFYLNGKTLAIFTAKFADESIKDIEDKLDYNLENKIQFIIFNRLSDLKESNIGLVSDEQYNIGGITHIVGSKVFIYYNGDHETLKRQIKSGIAQVILNEMIYGEQITAKIKNSTLLTLPDWYLQGLVSYMSEDWNVEIDNYVKDGILNGSYEKFNRLTGTDAVYAGHSLWKYIAEKYGSEKIPNILYMTKISKSVESGFLYVLGVSFKTFTQEWIDYYDKKYYDFDKQLLMPEGAKLIKNKNPKKVIQQIKISPDGKYAAFVTNYIGQYKIWLYNFENKKIIKLMKSGHKLDEKTDYSVPVLAWHPTGKRLAVITEKKGKTFLYYFNIGDKGFEKQRLFDFQKILSFSYSQSGKLLAMSGVINGQTDIYVYNLTSHTYEQITKDIYDDLDPVFINNSKQLIFSSNRVNDTIKPPSKDSIIIPETRQDLFLYDYSNKNKILRRLTNSAASNETNPLVINENYISYLSDQNGIINRFTAKLDSVISFVDTTTHYRYFTTSFAQTNYPRNILDYDICPNSAKLSEIIYNKGLYQIYTGELASVDNLTKTDLINSPFMDEYLKKIETNQNRTFSILKNQQSTLADTSAIKRKRFTSVHASDTVQSKNPIDINNYSFSTEVGFPKKKTIIFEMDTTKTDTAKAKGFSIPEFVLPKQRNYDVEYSIDQLVSQIDFSYLNNTYQPFTNYGSPIFINSGFNALFKVGVTDLLEDYRVTGGVRFSVDMDNTEYVLSYENLRTRLDKQILFHRQSLQDIQDFSIIKHNSNELLYILKWPFSQVIGLKGTTLLRNDRAVYLSTDINNLKKGNEFKTWVGLKGELTFDNTREKGLNIYYGTRWKLFAEVYRQVDAKNKQLNVIGFDFRNYKKISRTFIWANRFAASTSFGTQKLVYYMGGVDNWLFPKFNTKINIATDQNYAYQTLATNMRGFKQNIRNGNSFALVSSELRFPIFRYLINRPLKSDFFNNFQIVGFGDIGTAWTGSNPYSDKNALYTEVFQQGPITVTIKTQKEPIVGGYGIGLRTRLLGYFVRADWAWGVEDGIVLPNVFYLSLSLDF
jgi:Tol biopolymer transport system component